MKRDWIYLINPFLTLAKESRPDAIETSKYVREQLFTRQADPFWGPLFTMYDPLNQAVVDEDADWTAQKGAQKGSTTAFDLLLKDLSPSKINEWDQQVKNVYTPGSPQYIALFPQGHKPFQTGSKDDRVNAVSALSLAIAGIVALAAVKTSVDAFLALLVAARGTQLGQKGNTGTDSTDLSDALTAAMIGLFSIYGAGIHQFPDTPKTLEAIFPLSIIRTSEQTLFLRTFAPSSYDFIAKRTVNPTAKVKMKVLTANPVKIFVADEKNDTDPVLFKIINGLEEEIFDFSAIGNVPGAKFIKVQNMDSSADAKVEVELL